MSARIAVLLCALLMAAPAHAALESISNPEAAAGLKEALAKGSQIAVDALGRPDGFFGNAKVRIPLPESAQRVERMMRSFGMGAQADELILTLNRAAEAAVPQASALLLEAVKKMSVQDAKGILTGGPDSATQYFKRATSEQLRSRFLPIVRQATAKVKLADKYNEYAEIGARFGLIRKEDANLDDYVTRKALDGLFLMVAAEEARIRQDPAQAASALLRKVFGALH
ncbi:MAG: hypothetical protein A3I01_17955 [Betaproteobacteria bacterium RIFCSPLOWO2_02_FULL_65_24]|nr:MAG: hypothetical protein A3I01_17955 [Betaproteobacteria bacterium RIFCSPLOWO2_02_FULL_65_24]